MPADLVDLPITKAFLGVTGNANDAVLDLLSESLEGLLERETGRVFGPGLALVETQNGGGRTYLYVDRPVATLTSVKIGQDPAAPDESVPVGVAGVLVDPKGPRKLVRVDGGRFPPGTANVQVTYTSADLLPADCKLALLEAIALVWRRRGSEDAAVETTGTFSHELVQELTKLPTWARIISRMAGPNIA